MRSWSSLVFPRRNLLASSQTLNRLIHHVSKHQWLHRPSVRWHQYRLLTQRVLTISEFQQSLDPNWQPNLESANNDEDFQDLLSDAARYAIHNLDHLDFQASVNSRPEHKPRLVHDPRYQFDFELLAILLRYRLRVHGDEGIIAIWKFITRREHVPLLPAEWTSSDYLWSVFVSLGVRDHDFLIQIVRHMKRLWAARKMHRPTLYVELVGGLLRSGNSAAAAIMPNILHPGGPITSEELIELLIHTCASTDANAFKQFCLIYDFVPTPKIYGKAIGMLCEQERNIEAMTMHTMLLRYRDYPTSVEELEPLVRLMARNGLDMSALSRSLKEANISFRGGFRRLLASVQDSTSGLPREDIELATNNPFGIKRAKVSDAFAARIFATKSFSFDFALNGLYMLGLDEIGPLSLREIALQARTCALMRERLTKLDSMAIDTGGSAYSRVIRSLVRRDNDTLLMDVITCDQHPDVFEDQNVQLQLLDEYYQAKDWRQFNRTLAILGMWQKNSKYAPNSMLRRALVERNWPEVSKIAARLHQENQPIKEANIILMYTQILPPRMPGKHYFETKTSFKDLMFLITLWQNSLMAGSDIPSTVWGEPLRRLGMTGRWDDLTRLCHWLCSFYTHADMATGAGRGRANSITLAMLPDCKHRGHALIESILSPAMQRFLVECAFSAAFTKRHLAVPRVQTIHSEGTQILREAPWACGIEFLRVLQRQFEVRLSEVAIKNACYERLRQIFSIGGHSKSRFNQYARTRNKAKLQYYITWINKVYGKTLIDPLDSKAMSTIYTARQTVRSLSYDRWKKSSSHGETGEMGEMGRIGGIGGIGGTGGTGKVGKQNGDESAVDMKDIVMYRDLFHASWEDYQALSTQGPREVK
jgi:hypothetical protein